MTTIAQDRDFLETVIGTEALQKAMDWIRNNLCPEDVFEKKELDHWAEINGYVKQSADDMEDLEDVLDYKSHGLSNSVRAAMKSEPNGDRFVDE